MWEPEFANKKKWLAERRFDGEFKSQLDARNVSKISVLYWKEHCLECAPPECYHSCPLYEQRKDKRCVRVKYGIYRNPQFKGVLEFGADVRFKRWAKLGTYIYPALMSPQIHKRFQKLDCATAFFVNLIFFLTNPFNILQWFGIKFYNPQRLIFKAQAFFREWILYNSTLSNPYPSVDCFAVECFSFENKPFKLHIEVTDKVTVFKDSFEIKPGANYLEIPIGSFNKQHKLPSGSIIVYPENDLEARVVFTWLDFVKKTTIISIPRTIRLIPAEKVKCVAWDLDNTLWKGVLIEDGPEKIIISDHIKETIKKLDERGIIQTIASKNDHTEAWRVIEKNGLADYFLYPAINWAPKSSNLKKIADKINIDVDTFAFVDDSAFERAEVSTSLPQVRIYTEKQTADLLTYPEFDVPVTEASRRRRISYLREMQRERVLEEFGGDYEKFLKSCGMVLRIFTPTTEKQTTRCLELIQRSNQLNLSSKRYSAEEFDKLLGNLNVSCFALHCKDRFGEYGIVGFASVEHTYERANLLDFIISCRVAQKRVEHAFFEWLALREKNEGRKRITAKLIKTKKNGPLIRVFSELPFKPSSDTQEHTIFELDLMDIGEPGNIITIEDHTQPDRGIIMDKL